MFLSASPTRHSQMADVHVIIAPPPPPPPPKRKHKYKHLGLHTYQFVEHTVAVKTKKPEQSLGGAWAHGCHIKPRQTSRAHDDSSCSSHILVTKDILCRTGCTKVRTFSHAIMQTYVPFNILSLPQELWESVIIPDLDLDNA